MKKYQSIALHFSTAAALLFGAGCTVFPKTSRLHSIRTSMSQENADAFPNVDDLAARLSTLRKGMTADSVFQTLGVSQKRFSTIPDDQKMKYVDGPQIPQPHTADEQDKIKARVDAYVVRELAFSRVENKSGIGLTLSTERQTSGFDLRLQLTFKDGLFDKATLAGVQEINRYSKETILAVFGNAIKNGSAEALQNIVRNAIKIAP